MIRQVLRGLMVCVAILSLALAAAAENGQVSYQGLLTDEAGIALGGDIDITFRLYDALSGGSEVWNETQTVTVTQGHYQVLLGGVTPLAPALFDADVWLQLEIGGEVLTPRQPFASAPTAVRALSVPAGSIGSSEIATGAVGSSQVQDDSLTAADLAPDSVGSSEIATGAVGTEEVQNFSLTSADLAPNSVNNSAIADGTIINNDIYAYAAIAPTKIAGTAATLTGNQSFDGGTLYIDAANNRIGVGNVVPSEKLDVAGNIELTGDVKYSSARQRYLNIPPVAFVADGGHIDDRWNFENTQGAYAYISDGTTGADHMRSFASVNLPHLAQINSLFCNFKSYLGDDVQVALSRVRVRYDDTAETLYDSGTLAYPASIVHTFNPTITVDNSITAGYAYSIMLYWDTMYPGGTSRFYGCQVGYLISGAE